MNIIFYYKPKVELFDKYYFNNKKYTINLYTIRNFNKKIAYILIGYSNTIYNKQVWS